MDRSNLAIHGKKAVSIDIIVYNAQNGTINALSYQLNVKSGLKGPKVHSSDNSKGFGVSSKLLKNH